MRLQPLTESVIDLNFMPLEDIAHLPCLVANNCRFAGFSEMDRALYLDEELETALFIYKKLTLPELARLYQKITAAKVTFNWESFLNHYNLKWTHDLESIFQILPQTKLSFQNWVSQKDCGLAELQILAWAQNTYSFEAIDKLLNFISVINPSRQLGTKILEYALELFENLNFVELYEIKTADKLYEYIYSKRFPETQNKDSALKNNLLQTPWPAHVKTQAQRQGDRSGIEVKFFAGSFEEYEKRVDGLYQIKETVKRNLWNKN